MNPIKNPVGIDVTIERLRKSIDSLDGDWPQFKVYGKAYKKQTEKGISLEVYDKLGEYQKILFSEGNKVFFIQGRNPTNKVGTLMNDLWVCAILNLDEIGESGIRDEERVHQELTAKILKVIGLEDIQGLEYGIDNLKRVADDAFDFGNFKFSDLHPYHVFMVKVTVKYELIKFKC